VKKYICLIAILVLGSGCALTEWMGFDSGPSGKSGQSGKSQQEVAQKQLNDARASFNKKLDDSRGKTLAQLNKEWGGLDGGISREGLSVYQWRQTARLAPPQGEVTKVGNAQGTTLASCMAMFIVQNNVVVDATSEGECLDLSRMPAWRPYITQSSDGRKGEVSKL